MLMDPRLSEHHRYSFLTQTLSAITGSSEALDKGEPQKSEVEGWGWGPFQSGTLIKVFWQRMGNASLNIFELDLSIPRNGPSRFFLISCLQTFCSRGHKSMKREREEEKVKPFKFYLNGGLCLYVRFNVDLTGKW